MVSLARSGDSPESVGVLALMLKIEPKISHLVLTSDRQGKLATTWHPLLLFLHFSSFTVLCLLLVFNVIESSAIETHRNLGGSQ
jgi:fructoselysine-6-P-deglycase FrlB-like protein